MRIVIQALVEGAESVQIGVVERASDAAPSSGLGLLLAESRELLAALQAVVVAEQTREVVKAMSRCGSCLDPLAVKDTKSIVYRTAFGKASLPSPRLYARCTGCGAVAFHRDSFSPLALALPERTHPQWTRLQTRYASVMSYNLARKFLLHAFPGATALPTSSVRANAQKIGTRLEGEVRARIEHVIEKMPVDYARPVPRVAQATHALQVDAGYVRSVPDREGTHWISTIASKVVRPGTRRTHEHAYSIGYEPMQGIRQQAFLASIGISLDVPITVLSDGGEDVDSACSLPAANERILDWFHIGMRFEHLRLAAVGLKGLDDYDRTELLRNVEGAKWLLWHGRAEACLQRLEMLRRETGWVGKRNALGRLIFYLRRASWGLVNYAKRRAQGLPISSAGAESVVDHVVGQRMKRNGHMRWTRRGANNLLQVRCAVLNSQDVRNFKRWYPANESVLRAA